MIMNRCTIAALCIALCPLALSTTSVSAQNEECRQHTYIIAGHEAIDLGLESGLLWATCNIGAETPQDPGDYFTWGGVEPQTSFNQEDYEFFDQVVYDKDSLRREIRVNGLIKCLHIGHDISGTRLDAATVNWGHGWRMPTYEEIEELMGENLSGSHVWRTYGDKQGADFRNHHHGCNEKIYIPAGGFKAGEDLYHNNDIINCWSSTYSPDEIINQISSKATGSSAKILYLNHDFFEPNSLDRSFGLNIRPVISREDAMASISNIEHNARVDIRASHGDITVSSELPLSAVKVYSARGTEIYHVKASGRNHAVKALPDGIYIVELTFDNGRHYTDKVIL